MTIPFLELSVALLSGVGGAGTAFVFAIVCIVIVVIVLAVRKKARYSKNINNIYYKAILNHHYV